MKLTTAQRKTISDYMRQLGRSRSAAKIAAARRNGKLGGRPRKISPAVNNQPKETV